MKKIYVLALALLMMLTFLSCAGAKDDLVGKWIDQKTEQVYEYTSDGHYYEYTNESFTTDKTLYKVSGGKITYYIEDSPESEYTVSYRIKNGNIEIYEINGTELSENIVYKPYTEGNEIKTEVD